MISSVTSQQQLSENISSLCRICSAPGSHSLFAKIPPYLHEHPRECGRWKKPIHKLVTEVTGLDISEDDGLPLKICVLCISYLKHAYTFRRQAIDNAAALLAARYIVGTQIDKTKGDDEMVIPTGLVVPTVVRPEVNGVCYRMLNFGRSDNAGKNVPFQKSLDKEVLQQVLISGGNGKSMKKQNNIEEEQRNIYEANQSRNWGASPNTALSDSNGFFSYTEKEFEEDDIMELDALKEVTFNLPEDYKEKKCPSCRKRFMFDESLNEHLKDCLQFKLVKFVREVYHLLFLKENHSISPFEFIRRIVFSIRKSVQIIASYDGGIEEEEEEDNSEVLAVKVEAETPFKIDRSFLRNLEKLRNNYNQEGIKIETPATIELSAQQRDEERASSTTGSASISPVISTITRCEECQVPFETVAELEAHNLNYHCEMPLETFNNLTPMKFTHPPPPLPLNLNIPPPREVGIIRNRLLSPKTPDFSISQQIAIPKEGTPVSTPQFKKVQCSNCKKDFDMMAQLDKHRIRCQKSPAPQSQRESPLDRKRKNLNESYFYQMERLRNQM
ncbi:uncharacterized protein LOC129745915 [Uranotaenia lowii]|uniref:uncharacterized protein LOC129745915 n=1 Tax=Uranotaenia lowii TaxID=190385 RepID=UPI00247A4FA6|nr:uncharacterized protein LOC129745915 [Uranotaenia lowii]